MVKLRKNKSRQITVGPSPKFVSDNLEQLWSAQSADPPPQNEKFSVAQSVCLNETNNFSQRTIYKSLHHEENWVWKCLGGELVLEMPLWISFGNALVLRKNSGFISADQLFPKVAVGTSSLSWKGPVWEMPASWRELSLRSWCWVWCLRHTDVILMSFNARLWLA